jgi:hypothetical protein
MSAKKLPCTGARRDRQRAAHAREQNRPSRLAPRRALPLGDRMTKCAQQVSQTRARRASAFARRVRADSM